MCRHKGSLRARDPAGDQLQAQGLAYTPGVRGTVGGEPKAWLSQGPKGFRMGRLLPGAALEPQQQGQKAASSGGQVGTGGSTRSWFPGSGAVKTAAAQLVDPKVWVQSAQHPCPHGGPADGGETCRRWHPHPRSSPTPLGGTEKETLASQPTKPPAGGSGGPQRLTREGAMHLPGAEPMSPCRQE